MAVSRAHAMVTPLITWKSCVQACGCVCMGMWYGWGGVDRGGGERERGRPNRDRPTDPPNVWMDSEINPTQPSPL